MRKFRVVIFFVQLFSFLNSQEVNETCSSTGCVHAAADLLSRISNNIDPCEDFYEFSCGKFLQNVNPPDEKDVVNTRSILKDQLEEHLFHILSKPIKLNATRAHAMVKNLYKNCMNIDHLKELKHKEVLKLLDGLGGWPVLKKDWNESNWTFQKGVQLLHDFVGIGDSKSDNKMKETTDVDDGKNIQRIESEDPVKEEKVSVEALLKEYLDYMVDVAVTMGAEDSPNTRNQLQESLKLGLALNELLNGKNFKKKSNLKPNEHKVLKVEMRFIKWLKFFDNSQSEGPKSGLLDYSLTAFDNLKIIRTKVSSRAFANLFLWRIVEFSTDFIIGEVQEKTFKLRRQVSGQQDYDQRWKDCTVIANNFAALAAGSLYVKEYFPEDSRIAVQDMVNLIIEEYKASITFNEWMDSKTKTDLLEAVNRIKVQIGYDQKLLDVQEVENYYGKWEKDFSGSFFFSGLQLGIVKADKAYKRHFFKEDDWVKDSLPTSTNAYYNSKDNSIFFAAAFLQPPNYDKDRPPSMNFGAVGSIIAHELTHSFDRLLEAKDKVSKMTAANYGAKLKCLVDQYSSFRDTELNATLKGEVTIKEDTADNGGIKLAYRSYENWKKANNPDETGLIAFDYSSKQLFWISYAQFYCSVQRFERKKHLFDTNEEHTIDRFRVLGPLMNSQDFSDAFNCPINSKMNPERKRCAIW